MFTVDGLVSGLDTTSIIEGALSLQRSRIDRLNVRKQSILDQKTAFSTIEGQLLGLRGTMRSVLRTTNNAFDGKVATSSDEDAVGVSASSNAIAGTYQFRVTQLAQAHQIKSNGFESDSTEIGTGSVTIQVGARAQSIVEVDSSNNTLQGLANAINSLSDDVSATIVNDGSGGATPYRLLLSSNLSGAENEITITSDLSGGEPIDFSGPSVQDAQDAQVQLGTGEGAITVSSNDNQFDDLIAGVNLDVFVADAEKDVRITVENDVEGVTTAVRSFVESYNEVIEFINVNSRYDAEAESAGLLLGNGSASSIQSALRNAAGSVVNGVSQDLNSLTRLGISTDQDGKLFLSSSKLEDIIAGRVEGVEIDDIRRLFAIDGVSDNPGLEFVLGTNNTKASPIDPQTGEFLPYEVEINRVATKASLVSDSLTANIAFTSENNVFGIEVDNIEIEVTIPPAIYSREQVAEQLETLINTSPDRAGREITVEVDEDALQLTSNTFGRSSNLRILDGTANETLNFEAELTADGVDVAGVFRVNLPDGTTVTESATGNGRLLTSSAENEYTAQMQVRSNLSESQISEATDGHMTVTVGIAAALDAAIEQLLEPFTFDDDEGVTGGGEIAISDLRYDREIEVLDENIARIEERIEAQQSSMLRQFAALETTLAELQSVGDSLTASLLGL